MLRPIGSRNALNQCKIAPGDLVQGRILSIFSNGKALLQVGATKIILEHSFGGKVGEVLLFDVRSNLQSGKPEGQAKSSMSARLSGRSTSGKMTPTSIGSARGSVTMHPLRPLATSDELNSAKVDKFKLNSPRLATAIASLANKWIREARRRISARIRRDTSPARLSSSATPDRRWMNATVEPNAAHGDGRHDTDSPFDYSSNFWIACDGERYRFGRISLKTKPENPSADQNGHILTASFFLDLEYTGAVEIELRMAEDQIGIDFNVATESMRETLETRMPSIYTALRTLVERVYCQVQIDQRLIGMNTTDCLSSEVPKEIDLKI